MVSTGLIAAHEAASLLGVKVDTIRTYVKRGHLRIAHRLNATTNLYDRTEVLRLRDNPPLNGRPISTAFPRTPTMRRAVRPQLVAQILARGLSDADARATNIAEGWTIVAPDGGTIDGYRWVRGEWAVIAKLVEEARGGSSDAPPC